MNFPFCAVLLSTLAGTAAALEPLSEASLRDIDGGALGLASVNFGISGQPQSSSARDMFILTASGVQLGFNDFRFWGATPGLDATLGSASDPVWLDITTLSRLGLAGSDVSRDLLAVATPANAGKFSLGWNWGFVIASDYPGLAAGTNSTCCGLSPVTTANLPASIGSFKGWNTSRMAFNGIDLSNTNTEMWQEPGKGVAFAGRFNLKLDSLVAQVQLSSASDTALNFRGSASVAGDGALQLDGLNISLALGHLFYQPWYFDSPDGRNFKLTLEPIPNNAAIYNKFYSYNDANPSSISWTGGALNGFATGGGSIKNITIHQLELVTTGL